MTVRAMGVPETSKDSAALPASGGANEVLRSIAEATAQAGQLSISQANTAGPAAPEREPSGSAAPGCSDIEDIVTEPEEVGISTATQVKRLARGWVTIKTTNEHSSHLINFRLWSRRGLFTSDPLSL